MYRWLMRHIFFIFLLLLWLILNDSFAIQTFISGLIFVGLVMIMTRHFYSCPIKLSRVNYLPRLLLDFFCDIVISNLNVAKLIYSGKPPKSAFIDIPLEIRSPYALASLAIIITATPGSVWVGFSEQTGLLTLHVLDLENEQQWIQRIKQRYELPLREIFQ